MFMSFYPRRLKIWHVLSEPEDDWAGFRGRISQTVLDDTINQLPNENSPNLLCVCGPTDFTTETLRSESLSEKCENI